MTPPPAPTSAGAATRERLLRAAVGIVARDGLAAATTAAIAAAADVAEGTLYRHFESKDDLLIAAYREMKTEVFVNAGASIDVSLAPPERLKRTWLAIYRAYRSDRDAFAFGQRFAESALADREGGESLRAIGRMVSDLRKAGLASGDFKNLPTDLLGNLFLAPINYLLKAEIKGRKWTEAELDAAASAVLAGWKK
ncbi:MAG TPA: TetR/AcrR family transcriptional regulator [Hyphomonadaceae bacterium]|jgi:AcrR family transcriptional regulator|nr:TetR/AcrR family transcriptional regulator [Hyphomonadaceae bacterium]